MDELEFAKLKGDLEAAQLKITELEGKLAERDAAITEKDTTLASKDAAIAELQQYKDGIEGEKAKVAKLQSIKEKFTAAGLERDEAYFTENGERLLNMSDSDIEFMIQEMASFASQGTGNASRNGMPNLRADEKPNVKSIVEALRERNKK